MKKENWKRIQNINNNYYISDLGNVSNGNHLLKQRDNGKGYLCVQLYLGNRIFKRYYVHRLVAQAFIANPENKRTVNHIDGNKKNNSVDNLEWNTYSENNKNAYLTGLHKSLMGNSKVCKGVIALKGNEECYRFRSMREAERKLNLANGTIHMAIKHKWNYAGFEWKLIHQKAL